MTKLLIAPGSALLIAPGSALLISADVVTADPYPKTATVEDSGHCVTVRERAHTATAQENRP